MSTCGTGGCSENEPYALRVLGDSMQPEFKEGTTQMLVTTLDYSDYVGRIGIGRVFQNMPQLPPKMRFKNMHSL